MSDPSFTLVGAPQVAVTAHAARPNPTDPPHAVVNFNRLLAG